MDYSFDIEVAQQYGVNEAIMIKNLQFWIMKNKANGKHFHDGHTWTYNSVAAFMQEPYQAENPSVFVWPHKSGRA